MTLPASSTFIPILARGGSVIPAQLKGAKTTTESQQTPFHTKIFLDENSESSGELYWDDGDSLNTYDKDVEAFTHVKFEATSGLVKSRVIKQASRIPLPEMRQLTVSGLHSTSAVKTVMLNGKKTTKFSFNAESKVTP